MNTHKKIGLALALVGIVAGTAVAQEEIFQKREALMKSFGGALYGVINRMNKGTNPYDSAKAIEAVKTIQAKMADIEAVFPKGSAGSSAASKFSASPKIWQEPEKFAAAIANLRKVVNENVEVAGKDANGAKAAFKAINDACEACHDQFQLNKG
jgi:cytochrome c556